MNHYIEQALKSYYELLDRGDPRVEDWPMMSSPWPGILLSIIYTMLVTKILPKLMEKRAPFEIRPLMIIYNLVMVLLCTYMFVEFLLSGWLTGYTLIGCQPVDYSNSPIALRMASVTWVFYMSKFLEFLDTLFFVARKKYDHISFLHVFHHAIMASTEWVVVKYAAGGLGTFHCLCNSFIHMVMYTYYGLAAVGPSMQKYLWWKKYMTKMQMIQFVIVFTHGAQVFFDNQTEFPWFIALLITSYATFFLVMFANFYWKAYSKPINKKKSNAPSLSNNNLDHGDSKQD